LPALEYERGAQRRTHGDVTCTCLGVSSFRQILITAGTQLIGCYHVDVLERIKKQVGLVEELAGELEAEESYRGLERLIQLTIQALLDLGLMVIAALGHGRPRAYSEIGYLLRELGVLGERAHPHLRLVGGGLIAAPQCCCGGAPGSWGLLLTEPRSLLGPLRCPAFPTFAARQPLAVHVHALFHRKSARPSVNLLQPCSS
jgi:hypothetical protein